MDCEISEGKGSFLGPASHSTKRILWKCKIHHTFKISNNRRQWEWSQSCSRRGNTLFQLPHQEGTQYIYIQAGKGLTRLKQTFFKRTELRDILAWEPKIKTNIFTSVRMLKMTPLWVLSDGSGLPNSSDQLCLFNTQEHMCLCLELWPNSSPPRSHRPTRLDMGSTHLAFMWTVQEIEARRAWWLTKGTKAEELGGQGHLQLQGKFEASLGYTTSS